MKRLGWAIAGAVALLVLFLFVFRAPRREGEEKAPAQPARQMHRARVPRKKSERVIHVIKRGETLSVIAKHYGVSVEALCQANRLKNPDFIMPGQRLIVPSASREKVGTEKRLLEPEPIRGK